MFIAYIFLDKPRSSLQVPIVKQEAILEKVNPNDIYVYALTLFTPVSHFHIP